ncbi:MAG: hypothetical protein EXS13_02840 [Planctomycetes bacterium]|nr:hypothetical protein [Planctomycetota bacterium]
MHAAARFECTLCGNPLGARRVRQGVTTHPGCRRALAPTEVERALAVAQATLERLSVPGVAVDADAELGRLLKLATRQAAELIGDLKQLRSYVGGAPDHTSPRPR